MDKKLIVVFLAGWFLALFFPPTRVLSFLSGKKSG